MAQTLRAGPGELQRPLPKETEEGWGCPLAFQPCVLGLVEAGIAGSKWGARACEAWAGLLCTVWLCQSILGMPAWSPPGLARQQGSGLAACLPELLKD